MADKSIGDLNYAPGTVDDNNTLFVVQQAGAAYKLDGHAFITALTTILDGHGGVASVTYVAPVAPSLEGTMTVTLADGTETEVTINNGKGITSIAKTGTAGLADTYTITYNDGTTGTFTVTNGEKGDTGDAWYVWIKYAGQEPTQDSDMGDTPDNWMGIYSGTSSTAPTHYTDYDWFEIKGATGDTGTAADIVNQSVEYAVGDYGTVAPSGGWSATVPTVPQGKYLWTKSECVYNDGTDVVAYSVARMGVDGTGSVVSVNTISPDGSGNITLTASNIAASDNTSIQAHLTADETDIGKLKQAILYPTGDTTDRAAEIASKLSTYGYCELVKGEYYIGSTISMPSKSTLKGCGKESVIKKTSGSGNITMFSVTGTNQNVTFKDLYFAGSNTSAPSSENTGSGEQAIVLTDNAARVSVENCTFYGFTKAGIYYSSGYSWLSSLNIVNCSFLYCNYGISSGVYGEFANITNCSFNSCYYGALVIGGNNKFANCGFDANATGFVLWDDPNSPSNDGHGSCVGCTFDHNTSRAIGISNIDNGFMFSNCGIFYGDIVISNSRGIQFENCLIMGNKSTTDHTNFVLNNCPGLIAITNCCGTNAFTITKTSSSYVFAKGNKTRDGAIISADDRFDQTGYATGTSASAGTYSDTSVTFPVAYPSIPYVFICPILDSTSMETGKMQFFVFDVSTTGFKVRLFNNASISRSFNFNWRAYLKE